jgi:hypothetical protein
MSDLKFPDKPAGYLVETRKDGSALRNDGVELSPASQNPWYVLATVYGEYEDGYDHELAAKNRRIWNGWACARKSDDERAKLAKRVSLLSEDLADLTTEEESALQDAFFNRLPQAVSIPKPNAEVDMSGTHFSLPLGLEKCVFPHPTHFDFTVFSKYANFRFAAFTGQVNYFFAEFRSAANFRCASFDGVADFHSALLNGDAYFQSAVFHAVADFHRVTLSSSVNFHSTVFNGYANFHSVTFNKFSDFQSAAFSIYADFRFAAFSGTANFSNQMFAGQTVFADADFNGAVPKFYQRTLHQDTEFTTKQANWPTLTKDNAGESKRAYTRLRQMMSELHKPDDEHFFFRQEMRCKLLMEDGWNRWPIRIFGALSDYGYSVMRPIAWLGGVVGAGGVVITSYLFKVRGLSEWESLRQGIGMSVSNSFAFLGLGRKMNPEFFVDTPWWLNTMSATQSVLGIVLLFFLGLGLRNRFRIK